METLDTPERGAKLGKMIQGESSLGKGEDHENRDGENGYACFSIEN